jgi:hypothetical protein
MGKNPHYLLPLPGYMDRLDNEKGCQRNTGKRREGDRGKNWCEGTVLMSERGGRMMIDK